MAALGPDSPVWSSMIDVDEVLLVPDSPAAPIQEPSRRGIRTIVIPLMEEHIRHCPRQYLSLIPDELSLVTLGNKAAFAAYAEASGLAHLCPKTYANIDEAVFPCVLKRVDLNAGYGVTIVRSPLEVKWHLQDFPWYWRHAILQSLTAGSTEYVTHCICKGGQILWHCSFAYEMDSPERIRTPFHMDRSRPATTPAFILSQIEKFLLPLAFTGPCNVDYKISDGGNIVVFEINPRLGGSLMMPRNVDQLSGALSHLINAALG
jgi:carbamoylphosphate synthase large subunit